ncbi:efflux transporter outer membrane subunit [Aquabacterium sp.]|uniref:efflux transporter outer membrane subunit n=1 Tax=Aquabacterium sp. TaxID=1872578 RepID=UPI0035B465E5
MSVTRLPLLPTTLLTVSALSVLAACTTVEVKVDPGVAVPAAFAAASGAAGGTTTDLARWWDGVGDPTLTRLIDSGLQANTDIRMALDRVKEARAVVTQAESALYPTIEAVGGVAKTKLDQRVPSGSLPGITLPNGTQLPPVSTAQLPVPLPSNVSLPMTSLGTGGLAAAWEVDIFGARRSDAEAARQAALGYEERLHGAQMMVVSDIATNYFEARSIERRRDVLARSIATAQRLQRYAEGRFEAGQANRSDIDRARSIVEALQSQRQPLDLLLGTRLRRLAVLTGQPPQSLTSLPTGTTDLPALDALPRVLPSDVLERRPDVRGSANVVRAQAARLGGAKAELFPKFTIGFLAQDGHIDISGVGTTGGTFTSWGVGVTLPLFEAGRIRANIAAQDARLDAAAAQYEQAVLNALEDVENAYSARHALDARATLLAQSTRSAQDSARHADRLFDEGTGLLQPVLEAQLRALQSEDDLIQAETARAVTTVLLYKAIGGGWVPGKV